MASVAFVWAWTAVGVIHPWYREMGMGYLAPLGLPSWVMWGTCVAEAMLAGVILYTPPARWLVAVQTAMIAAFSTILIVSSPILLVHPMGVLTKNIPLLAVLWGGLELYRHGWTPMARGTLRFGMGIIWITEGLFPKLLFQQPVELVLVESLLPSFPVPASLVIMAVGLAQVGAGLLVFTLRGRCSAALLYLLAAALIVLPLGFTFVTPEAWFDPFGPFSKNVPILAGTLVLAYHESSHDADRERYNT